MEIIEKTPKVTFIKIKFLKRMIYERPVVEKKKPREIKKGKNVHYTVTQNTKKPLKVPARLKEIKRDLELQPPQLQNVKVNKYKAMIELNKKNNQEGRQPPQRSQERVLL